MVLPFGLIATLWHKALGDSTFFDLFAQSFSLVPSYPGAVARACYYKLTLKQAYFDLNIGFGSGISKIDTEIGRNVFINGHTTIGLASIGEGVVVANYVSILSGRYQHNFSNADNSLLDGQDSYTRLIIGPHSFIGDKSVIMANIGKRTIIGAGSIVVKDIPDHVVAVGNPARVVKNRRTLEQNDQ